MLSILLHLIFNPFALAGIGGFILIGVAIYFTLGLPVLLKIVTDIRTWFAIALVLAVLAFVHAEQRTDKLEADIATAAAQKTSDTDSQKTTDLRVTQKTARQAQTTRHQQAIASAAPGTQDDAVLDSIAQDHGTVLVKPQALVRPPVLVQAPVLVKADGSGDRASDAVLDGLRKHQVVTVVP